jgi:hypothetical protein
MRSWRCALGQKPDGGSPLGDCLESGIDRVGGYLGVVGSRMCFYDGPLAVKGATDA